MRDLIVTENITVDGVIDASEGWFSVLADDESDDLIATMTEHREAADALLTGRVTFEELRGYWPAQAGEPTGTADYLDRVAKYVVSSTLEDPAWENTTVLRGDVLEEVQRLKEDDGADIVCTGSMQLVATLVEAGLVDEYRLFVYPVVLGRGHRLFADQSQVGKLELVEARALGGGIVLQRYRSA